MKRLLCVLALATGCVPIRHAPSATELTRQEWDRARADARAAVEGDRHARADTLLAAFAAQHPGTPEATETLYWRGVYRLDPANRTHSPADAIAMLDAYLAAFPADSADRFRAEAVVLRRTAASVDRLSKAVATAAAATVASRPAGTEGARPAEPSKDEEIARLKSELEKATDELNRIKRRLSAPRP